MGWALKELEAISYFGKLNMEEASLSSLSQLAHNLDVHSSATPYLCIPCSTVQNMANLSVWI